MGVSGQHHALAVLYPQGKDPQYPLGRTGTSNLSYPLSILDQSYRFHWFFAETGFDIITPDELKSRHTKDPNWGVDLVIDCTGYAPAMEEALTLINPGGRMCIFGITSPQARIR
jgi:threonine dehydrogenase-like Zn-dependent dehydrogenase